MVQMQRKEINVLFVSIVLVGVMLFLLATPRYNYLAEVPLIALIGYFIVAEYPEPDPITDRKLLWEAARQTPGGYNRIRLWTQVQDHNLQTELFNNIILYSYDEDASRHGLALNMFPDKRHPIIVDQYDPHENPMNLSTWRDWIIDKAYNTNEKMTYEKAVKVVESHGGRVVWPTSKKPENTDNAQGS